MLAKDLWVGVQSATLLTGTSRQNCYSLADSRILVARHSENDKRYVFQAQSLADRIGISLNEEACEQLALADVGNAAAMREFGLILLSDDHAELAIGWFHLAAKSGDADAMDWLSQCYLEGIGTAPDTAQGIRWLGEAAMHGHPIAQAKLRALEE